ncbi:MAG: thioredoxin family protein [Thermoanaerobaculia bacterium]
MKPTTALWIVAALFLFLALPDTARGGSAWLESVDAAVAQAQDSGRLILVDLYADWCSWCKRLEAEVFSHPRFREYAEGFELLRVDTEDRGEGSRLLKRFAVSVLPTTLIIDHRMVKVGEVRGFTLAEGYIARIEEQIARYRRLEESFASLGQTSDPLLLSPLAFEFHERRDFERAVELYDRLLALPDRDPKQERWTRYRLVDALRMGRRFDRAAEELGRMRQTADATRDRILLEQLDLLDAELARERGDCRTAVAVLESFLRRNPESFLREEARRTLRSLEAGSPECA